GDKVNSIQKASKTMKPSILQFACRGKLTLAVIGMFFLGLLTPVHSQTPTQQAQSQEMTTTTTSDTEQAPALPSDQLNSLVAPIALYSDPLLAQTLAASTYPLEVIQLQQWMAKNPDLKDKALADAVSKQPWDPSIQGLVAYPDVVTRMADNIQWTTDLGNAFLAQQSDVMDAVQRMRAKAQGTGNLKTSAQQVVQTETVASGKQVIEIQQANPDVVYVPSYDPQVVYGAAPPAYPYYPYTYPGYVPGTALAWGRRRWSARRGGWRWWCRKTRWSRWRWWSRKTRWSRRGRKARRRRWRWWCRKTRRSWWRGKARRSWWCWKARRSWWCWKARR